jgi:hypothetical protein
MAVYRLRTTSINKLKRKELVGNSVETLERAGIVDTMPLDQHIGVRIPGGQPKSYFCIFSRFKVVTASLPDQFHYLYFAKSLPGPIFNVFHPLRKSLIWYKSDPCSAC